MAAGDSVIGALRVVLGLDSASLEDGLKKSSSALGDFGKQVGIIASGIQLQKFVEDAVAGLKHLVLGSIDAADEMGKMAQKTGVPIEQLSGLKFAAELANVSFEQLGKGLEKLSKNILDGVTNPTGDAAKAFRSLDIQLKDSSGNIKNAGDVTAEVATKFAGMEDGAGKTALAIKLFGRAGADLIPLLNEGGIGIAKMTAEARDLGIIISQETAVKAQEFNDTLKRLETVTKSVGLQLAEALLPTLQSVATGMLNATREGGFFRTAISFIGDEFIKVSQEAQIFALQIGYVADAWGLLKQITPETTFGDAKKIFGEIIDLFPKMQEGVTNLRISFTSPFKIDALSAMIDGLANLKWGLGKVDDAALHTKDSFDKWGESVKKHTDELNAQVLSVGLSAGATETLKTFVDGLAAAEKDGTKATNTQIVAANNLAVAMGLATDKVGAAKLANELTTTSSKKYQDQVDLLTTGLNAGAISQDKFNAAMANLKAPSLTKFISDANDLSKQLDQFSTKSVNALTDSLVDVSRGTTSAGDAWKKLGDIIVEALIRIAAQIVIANTVAVAAKALGSIIGGIIGAVFGGPIGAAAGAAGGGALGTFVAGLFGGSKGLSVIGAAGGSSFTVPGGMSSVDTTMLPLALSPGERVDVTPGPKAKEQSAGYLNINPINPREFFTGDVVREMVYSIDKWMRDGGTGVRFATIK